MSNSARVLAKVLVQECDDVCFARIQAFCEENCLVPQRVQVYNFAEALEANIDLAGIFLSERTNDEDFDGIVLGRLIRRSRPELPIFLRRESANHMDDLSTDARRAFVKAFTIDSIDALHESLHATIFQVVYPDALVRGLTEITHVALESQFIGMRAETDVPYIVLDKLICGEIFTLIPLESGWCRGYMMLQVDEDAVLALVNSSQTHARLEHAHDFRNLNGVLQEITNLIWGAFKNKYMSVGSTQRDLIQVPMVINPGHQHISFGSDNPQLCLKHHMHNLNNPAAGDIVVYQKFVFNMHWNPEDFHENTVEAAEEVDSGELEMF